MFLHVKDKAKIHDLDTVYLDGKRHYVTPEGNVYPSVTTVVGAQGKSSLDEWRKRIGEQEADKISRQAANRGNKLHKLCEDYLNNELSIDGEMPTTIQLFNSIKPIIQKYINNIYEIESPLYSDHLKVAGRVDCIAEFDGKISIIDFKTSSKPKLESYILNYFMQASAYAVMFEERTGISVSRLAIIIAVENDQPQVFIKKRDDYIGKFIEYRNLYDTIK
jgi:CRISPR/Cas system-associated exonuclease Cas4 (RecB family)